MINQGNNRTDLYLSYIEALAQSGLHEEALGVANFISKRNYRMPSILYKSGRLLAKLGKNDKAITRLRNALELFRKIGNQHKVTEISNLINNLRN